MNISSRNLCIIPARGGSKRILKKNIKLFLNKPIIAYSIEVALESNMFEEIIVSTDDVEIATIAEEFGATVPFFRSEKTSDDHSTLSDVIEEVKQYYVGIGVNYDNICCILATAPFITKDLLENSFQLLLKKRFDSVRPVVRFGYPIQRALRLKDGQVSMFDPTAYSLRSQDVEMAFHDAGLFYWMDFEKGLLGQKKGAIEISEKNVQDIDTPEDWELAELKYKMLHGKF